MNKIYKVAVIGGGAAGLLCAVELLSGADAFRGEEIAVIERNDRVGKKILATGNGQGNISNADISADNYSGDKKFISDFIVDLKKLDLLTCLKKLGIYTTVKEDGKIYPVSMQANSVLDAIRVYLSFKDCMAFTGERVTDLKKENGAFAIFSDTGKKFYAEKVVLATGGKAGKQFGTDGSGYTLATDFGHTVTPLVPSLVQLKTEKGVIKGLKGVKEYALVSLYDGEKFVKSAIGDVLFTDYGVSGNAVFKLSDKVAGLKKPALEIEFVPDISEKDLAEILKEKSEKPFIPYRELLNGIINKKLGEIILSGGNKPVNEIARVIKKYRVAVTGMLGFDSAQVTKGGVNTREITRAFESKIISGLYIVGEETDVDGECGGYNLTFAFASGIIAARDIKCREKE